MSIAVPLLLAGTAAQAQQRMVASPLSPAGRDSDTRLIVPAALYPVDHRRPMQAADFVRFPGAGILYCFTDDGVPQKAAASWLIGSRSLVMMNAHVFRDHRGAVTRNLDRCYFQIEGRNYDFDPDTLELGIPPGAKALHITDDWALARLQKPVEASVRPQPLPLGPPDLPTGEETIPVTMVSPAGHANGLAVASLESCAILAIDPPSQDGIRRARHDCNDGFGGSGSGLFDKAGHLIAMHSASLDMDRILPFDIDYHYGSALLIEGKLLEALRRGVDGVR